MTRGIPVSVPREDVELARKTVFEIHERHGNEIAVAHYRQCVEFMDYNGPACGVCITLTRWAWEGIIS